MDWNVLTTIAMGMVAFVGQGAVLVWKAGTARAMIYEKIMQVEKEMLKSQLEVSETYVEKSAFQNIMSNLDSRLIRLESKLDRALSLD